MKTLIVFYSRTGITRKVGQKIAAELGADSEEIIDTENRAGAWGYLKSGKEAMQKKLGVIAPVKYNPENYDLVVVGTPTWSSTMACAVRTYLTEHKTAIKEIAVWATHISGGGEKANRFMAELVGKTARAEIVLKSKDVATDNYDEKFTAFIEKLK
ncbi:MAG: flavodoxin [Patescibacteria group bacterium]